MQIYIHRNNQQLGPFTEAEIKAQVASGVISPQDHVWWEGQANWIPLAQSSLMTPAAATIPGVSSMPVDPVISNAGGALQPTSKLAVWALVCAGLGIFCAITQIPAIILGHLSLAEIKKNPNLKGRSMAITALVIGYLWLFIVIVCVAISVFTAANSNVKDVFTTINAQLKAAEAAQATNSPDQSATNSGQTTNAPDQNTNSPDQSTNSAPATNSPDASMTNAPSTNAPDSTTNAPSTNAPDSATNAAPMSQ
jgi:hypothetical protein